MTEKSESAERDTSPGIDVTTMQLLLKMTPMERFRWAVESSNNVRRVREAAQRALRRK